MRVSLAQCAAIVMLSSLVGCSTISSSQFWPKFSFRGKKPASSTTSESALANAPAAPQFNSATAAVPSVSMSGATQTSGSMPVYPGTTYPVTPYPATTVPSGVAASPYSGYPGETSAAPQGVATAQPASAYAANPYGSSPYAANSPTGGYAPGSTAGSYAPQSAPYNPPAPAAATYNTAEQPGTVTR